jgi:hypothetical protein
LKKEKKLQVCSLYPSLALAGVEDIEKGNLNDFVEKQKDGNITKASATSSKFRPH